MTEDGRRKRGLKGACPLNAKHELQSSESEILEEENREPAPTIARGRAYLSECAVYGKGLCEVLALWVRPRPQALVYGLEKSERDGRAKDKQIADLQRENGSLRGQIRSLTAQLDEVKAELWNKINNLTDKLKGAYESLTNVVKAVGMLKYDREKDQNGNYTYGKYGISNLSKAQDKLIDGLAEYGARWAKEDGFPEMAEEMEKRVGISKGIEKIIEPQAPKRSRGYEMEL